MQLKSQKEAYAKIEIELDTLKSEYNQRRISNEQNLVKERIGWK
jgi:hypothetical protein